MIDRLLDLMPSLTLNLTLLLAILAVALVG